jgi:hypothetical protein
MLGREIVEGQQGFPILGQAGGGLVVFGLVLGEEPVEGLLGVLAAFGLPNLLQVRLGFGLD